jgi:TetR/AcrR family transcriptional regulator
MKHVSPTAVDPLSTPAPFKNSKAKEDLLEAVSKLMRDGDTLDITLSDIATAAGVNSALVKYYFGNKDGMLLALLERDVSNSIIHLRALMSSDLTSTEKVRRHIGGLIRMYFRYPYINRLLLAQIRQSSPDRSEKILDQMVRPIAEAYRTVIEEGVRSGEFRRVDPTLFYFTIIGACDQMFSAACALPTIIGESTINQKLRDRQIAHTTTLLLQGLLSETMQTGTGNQLGNLG